MKRSNDQSIKEALSQMLRDLRLDERVNEERLKKKWEALFGKLIMKYTKQIRVKDKKLFLSIDSASLKQELLFNKQKMIDRINAEIAPGMIEDIVLR